MNNSPEAFIPLGEALKEKRLASGYSQVDLAALLNEIVGGAGKFTASELNRWEAGEVDMKTPRLFALCQFFGIDRNTALKGVRVEQVKNGKR